MMLRLWLLFLAALPEVISFASHQDKKLIQRREVQLFTIKEDGHGQDSRGNIELSRRNLFNSAMKSALTIGTVLGPAFQAANAGLVQFPCDYDLMNTYHFMRAGESLLESQNLLSTNPLFLTNREDALSPLGIEQVNNAMNDLMMKDINPSVVKYSLAAKSIDTANMIANEMQVGRNRLVPEYTFMDPRGVGSWNMLPLSSTENAIWAMDNDEAGEEGKDARPPANDDGTANETLSEQVTRLRQLMSILETQFSGDEILLVFGDGTSPALLSTVMAGSPLNLVHQLDFQPGEVRYDVTKDSVLHYIENDVSPFYNERIERGRKELKDLREKAKTPIVEDIVTIRTVPVVKERPKSTNTNTGATPESTFPFIATGTAIAVSTSLAPQKSDIDDDHTDVKEMIDTTNDDFKSMSLSESPELIDMEKRIEVGTFDIPEMKINEEEIMKEKFQIAEKAMTEYLNQDDGFEDWLSQMKTTIEEE